MTRLLRRGRQVALQRVERLGKLAGVDLQLERLQRRHLARGVERQGALQRREGGGGIAEPDHMNPRELQQHGHLAGPVAGLRGETGQRVGVAAMVAPLGEDPLQDLQRGRDPRGEGEGALHPLHHPGNALGIVGGMKLGYPEMEQGGAATVLARDGRLVELGDLLPPGPRHRPQPLARFGRAGRVSVERHRLDERVHGEAVLERLVDERCPQLGVLGRQGAGLRPVLARSVEQLLRLPEPAQRGEAVERAEARLGQLRIEPLSAGVEQRGPVPPSQPLLVDLRQAEGEGCGLVQIPGVDGRLLQRGGQGGPVPLFLEQGAERLLRNSVLRVEPQQLPVEVFGLGEVAELLAGEQSGAR